MKLNFTDQNFKINNAVKDFFKLHEIEAATADGCQNVCVKVTGNKEIIIKKSGMDIEILIDKPYQLFRGLTLIKNALKNNDGDFLIREEVQFESCSVMFDGSQANSLMNNSSYKKMILYLASMGYSTLMLYCEDCYEIQGEPYFGNMRPRYTPEDFKMIDDYAYDLGIEVIPCIQTLGHLSDAIRRPPYNEISDCPDILMSDDERVYNLIDKMIASVSKCFRSNRIHVGLDEAWTLGLGNYLKKNGYQNKSDIMKRHVAKVTEIALKHGVKPMMWADMFYRIKSETEDVFDDSVDFDDKDKELVPKGMDIVFWDYYHFEKEYYFDRISKGQKISDNVIFAGCSRNVRTFGSHIKKTFETTNPALAACKDLNVKEVMTTVWGDNHRESSTFAVLPGLMHFAEHMYTEGTPTQKTLEERFLSCVNVPWEAFADIALFDSVPGYNDDRVDNISISRAVVYQDILLGLLDYNMKGMDMHKHYKMLGEKMKANKEKYPDFSIMFEFYQRLANLMEVKQFLGVKTTRAYKNCDKAELKEIAEVKLPEVIEKTRKLREAHRGYFFDEYKPIGWECQDIRYGGVIARCDTAIKRINDFLSGKIEKIEELEEERLSFSGIDDIIPENLDYLKVCSASRF